MRLTGEPAFVLHRRPFSESSLVVELFTRNLGRVAALAKGARRPGSPLRLLDPFQPLLIGMSGRGELPTLTHAEADGCAYALAGGALFCGFYLNELLLRLLER